MKARLSSLEIGLALAVCIATPLVHWFTVGPQMPHPTHLLLSQLGPVETLSDPSKVIYTFARPPIYIFLGWIISHPAAFLLVGLLMPAVLCFCIFLIAMSGLRRMSGPETRFPHSAIALILVVIIYPLGIATSLEGQGTVLIPQDFFHSLSNRTFFYVPVCLAFLCTLEGRDKSALLLTALSCYSHLTAGVLAFGLLSLIVFWRLCRSWKTDVLIVWAIAALIGAIPPLTQFLFYDFPPELTATMSDGEWYSQNVKDEADDFSVLFQLAYRIKPVAAIFSAIALTLVIYALQFRDFRRDLSFHCALAIPLMFLAAALYEYLFGVLYPSILIRPLIGLTIGYRLLSFAFYPLIVLGARILAAALEASWVRLMRLSPSGALTTRRVPAVAAATVIVAVSLGMLRYGAYSGGLEASASYSRWALTAGHVRYLDTYLSALARTGRTWYPQPPLYEVEGDYVTYPGVADLFEIRARDRGQPERRPVPGLRETMTQQAFFDLAAAIRGRVAVEDGLYVPPYLRGFRESLPDHDIYFQEHWDGNWMMGSPRFMKFWNGRMLDLLGFTYEGMPSKHSGLNYSAMRDAFLAIGDAKARWLFERNPSYRYVLTEPGHRLGFAVALRTPAFVLYDLRAQANPD